MSKDKSTNGHPDWALVEARVREGIKAFTLGLGDAFRKPRQPWRGDYNSPWLDECYEAGTTVGLLLARTLRLKPRYRCRRKKLPAIRDIALECLDAHTEAKKAADAKKESADE